MNEYLWNAIIAFAIAVLVSAYFYRLAKKDAETLYRCAQLDSVILRLKQLAPQRKEDSERSKDGVDSTSHWIDCVAEIMAESQFHEGGLLLNEISDQMKQTLQSFNKKEITDKEAVQRKKIWYGKIRALASSLPRSPLSRNVSTQLFPF